MSAIRTACLALGLLAPQLTAQDLDYDQPFFQGEHTGQVSTPEEILGFRLGERPAEHREIEQCFKLWEEQSDRATLLTHGETFEGRTLYHIVISSPANLSRIDDIQKSSARLADARDISEADAKKLLDEIPAVAWMAYSIHGDELSGADAALACAWHFISSTDDNVTSMLDDMIIIIDPMMNPDGRDRYLGQLREMRGNVPTTDDQARLHGGRWPQGRTNHYLFDLNRDWTLGVNPETRGRIKAINKWHPLLMVDAHEMGGQDTYLFSPSREPINPNYSDNLHKWLDVFAGDQAGAFDGKGWRYYTGEWADDWYPGYSNAWSAFRGAIGILYEQAGVDWYGIKRPEGRVLTYRESVHHQVESTLANIKTLHDNAGGIKLGWYEMRKQDVAADSPYANRTFAITPTENRSRLAAFVDLMELQGFEMFVLNRAYSAAGTDRLGRDHDEIELPAGTLLIPNRQPNARLLATMLEFDPHMSEEFLAMERRELVRTGSTEIYDITGWSTPMMHDLEAYELRASPPGEFIAELGEGLGALGGGVNRGDNATPWTAWIVGGMDDQAPALAMELMAEGVAVRYADEAFTWGDRSFSRGSLVITREDQTLDYSDFVNILDRLCQARNLQGIPVDTGFGQGDIADIGGEHFDLLAMPRIAVLGEAPVSAYDFGSIWYTLDERYKLPATYLSAASMRFTDLRRYNVLVLPSGANSAISGAMDDLRQWVEAGGTLIAIGSSARALARENGLSDARDLSAVLDDLDTYEIGVLREWAADTEKLDPDAVWSHGAGASEPTYPWAGVDLSRGSAEELKRRDNWQRQFMTPGTIVASRVDDEHWLTAGCNEYLPILYSSGTVFMAKDGVEAPLRYGVLDDAPGTEAQRVGWSTIPSGKQLLLRMSGLLWPEAAHRIANGAAVTRERVGMGQVILFADSPTFRATSLGTTRVFMNAVIYGPGLGSNQPIGG